MMQFDHGHLFNGLRLALIALVLSACEAPLNLSGVEQERQKLVHRTDRFQAIDHRGDQMVLVGAHGAVMSSDDAGQNWQRRQLPGKPMLIDVAMCDDGRVAALDSRRHLWVAAAGDADFRSFEIPTQESLLTMDCAPDGRVWVGGSFSTLLSSSDGEKWQETSLNEDLMFTTLQFLDDQYAVATGEFGSVAVTEDGGANWQPIDPMPNEFYPQASLFTDRNTGWSVGLNGKVLSTKDAGRSWQVQKSETQTPLYGLASNGGKLYAVGDNGTVLRLEGERWLRMGEEPVGIGYLRAVAALGDRVVVAGAGVVSELPAVEGK